MKGFYFACLAVIISGDVLHAVERRLPSRATPSGSVYKIAPSLGMITVDVCAPVTKKFDQLNAPAMKALDTCDLSGFHGMYCTNLRTAALDCMNKKCNCSCGAIEKCGYLWQQLGDACGKSPYKYRSYWLSLIKSLRGQAQCSFCFTKWLKEAQDQIKGGIIKPDQALVTPEHAKFCQ